MQKLKPLYIWWITVLLVSTGAFWAYHANFIQTIWNEDVTFLTSASVLLLLFSLLLQFRAALFFSQSDYSAPMSNLRAGNRLLDVTWFLSEIMMALGLLGTVIGLIYMLQKTFGGGNINVEQLSGTIGLMWKGLGVALYTNVVGLVCSIITKLSAFAIGYRHAD
jgi:hypothetical protein